MPATSSSQRRWPTAVRGWDCRALHDLAEAEVKHGVLITFTICTRRGRNHELPQSLFGGEKCDAPSQADQKRPQVKTKRESPSSAESVRREADTEVGVGHRSLAVCRSSTRARSEHRISLRWNTESIINTLSQLPQLKVLARSTVFRYKGARWTRRR